MAAPDSRGYGEVDRARTRPPAPSLRERVDIVDPVARAARDVFIDNRPDDPEAIRAQLAKLEQIARKHGKAVGIGHPHDATLTVLSDWLTEVRERGFALVPISAIAVREFETAESVRSPTR